MRLTETAIQKIDDKEIRLKLALALGFTEQWIIASIAKNKENGPLTTYKALQVITKETGLRQKEILEEGYEEVKTD